MEAAPVENQIAVADASAAPAPAAVWVTRGLALIRREKPAAEVAAPAPEVPAPAVPEEKEAEAPEEEKPAATEESPVLLWLRPITDRRRSP